jgi:hypothetical protein
MNTSGTSVAVLHSARVLYERSPSHVAMPDNPRAGTYCAVTAIATATRDVDSCWEALELLRKAAGYDRSKDSLSSWNARVSTEEVLRAFDKAIDLAASDA